jgi:hypothetical protein
MSKTLNDAVALYRMGKSPAQCEKLTGIHYKKIEREVKKLGVSKGDVSSLTSDLARDLGDFVKLPVEVQALVSNEVARLNHFKALRDEVADLAFTKLKDSIVNCENNEIKGIVDALDKLCITTEIAARHSTNSNVVNNINAQHNISEELRPNAIIFT